MRTNTGARGPDGTFGNGGLLNWSCFCNTPNFEVEKLSAGVDEWLRRSSFLQVHLVPPGHRPAQEDGSAKSSLGSRTGGGAPLDGHGRSRPILHGRVGEERVDEASMAGDGEWPLAGGAASMRAGLLLHPVAGLLSLPCSLTTSHPRGIAGGGEVPRAEAVVTRGGGMEEGEVVGIEGKGARVCVAAEVGVGRGARGKGG